MKKWQRDRILAFHLSTEVMKRKGVSIAKLGQGLILIGEDPYKTIETNFLLYKIEYLNKLPLLNVN